MENELIVQRDKVLIKIKALRKVYKIGTEKVVALDKIDLEIGRGEICCILGTSGSGKSTLLNMLAGLEKPTSGSVTIEGKEITSFSEKQLAVFRQANLGFVFQSYNLLATMTALDNVAMPLLFLGVSRKERNARASRILHQVGLGTHINHKPTEMSGGQQQRVGIARAYANVPKIVFADEPTGNLDSKTTLEVMAIIVNLARDNDQTLVLVTHNPEIASYANRIVHIIDGNIQKIEVNDAPILPPRPACLDAEIKTPKKKKKKKKASSLPKDMGKGEASSTSA